MRKAGDYVLDSNEENRDETTGGGALAESGRGGTGGDRLAARRRVRVVDAYCSNRGHRQEVGWCAKMWGGMRAAKRGLVIRMCVFEHLTNMGVKRRS